MGTKNDARSGPDPLDYPSPLTRVYRGGGGYEPLELPVEAGEVGELTPEELAMLTPEEVAVIRGSPSAGSPPKATVGTEAAVLEAIEETKERLKSNGRRPNSDFRTRLLPDQQAYILVMHEKGVSARRIAEAVGSSHPTVIGFIRKYQNTLEMAKATLRAGAQELAERVVERAGVDQSMEVLDRLDVLPKKRNDAGSGATFNVMIGGVVQRAGESAPRPPAPLDAEFTVEEG